MKKSERETLAEIKRLGFIVKDLKRGRGSHIKAQVTSASGAPVTIVFGTSPSDHRAGKNFSALLRRLQQEAHR
jgi:hypothetical protein